MKHLSGASVARLFHDPILHALHGFAARRGVRLYLVGGSVRDLLLGRQTTDLDFTLALDAFRFARRFAGTLGATCIRLEEVPSTARVIVKQEAGTLHMDFAQFRAASLDADLRLRDLTINAMAIALGDVQALMEQGAGSGDSGFQVRDPCGGMEDLNAGVLRFPSEAVVTADPVRLLRIYRFAAQLDFRIAPPALDLVRKHRALLSGVAGERCRDELLKILQVQGSASILQRMRDSGLLTTLMPTVRESAAMWAQLSQFEATPIPVALHAYQAEITQYLNTTLSAEMDRRSLLKLRLLLGASLQGIGERLRLSRKAVQFMTQLSSGTERLTGLSGELTQAQRVDFLRAYRSEWWGVLLYAAATGSIGSPALRAIGETYYRDVLPVYEQGHLLTGRDLIARFQLKEGTEIGRILAEIADRQFSGEVRTREEAFAAAAAILEKQR